MELLTSAAEENYAPAQEAIRNIQSGLNAQIFTGQCDLFYYAANIIDERADEILAPSGEPVVSRRQRREEQAKRDGMVRKRSDGRWEARIVIGHKNDGTPMHKSVFGKTQKETLDKLHRAIETCRDVDLCEDSRMTLGEWLDKWLDEYMIFTLRESTMQSYRMIVNHYIK